MTIIFKDYKNLKFNEIESLLFNLCPIYRVPGLKPHKRPWRIFEQKCFIREIKNIDDDEVEIPARVQYKTDRWPLTKNKKMSTLDQCAGSDEIFRAISKSKNNMDQIDKTNINDKSSSYVKIYIQLINTIKVR